MKSYMVNSIQTSSATSYKRFEVTSYTGTNSGDASKWMVASGTAFKGFTYDTGSGSIVPIKGLCSGFDWPKGAKVYLDFDISPSLQVTGCTVKCTKVGKDSQYYAATDAIVPEWADFPNMFRITPKDEFDPNTGLVKKIADGKHQTKAYLLLATRSDDDEALLAPQGTQTSTGNFTANRKTSNNVIMMVSQTSGVQVVFPMPWHASMFPDDHYL